MHMENQNMETQQQGAGEALQQQERTFSQEEVNRIVQDRLARARNTGGDNGDLDRTRELDQREIRLDARERLADAGLPKDLLPLVNCSSREEMEKSITLIGNYLAGNKGQPSGYRISTGAGSTGPTAGTNRSACDADIRKAMGLKG